MPDEFHLSHTCEYGKTHALAQKGAVILGLLFVIMLILRSLTASGCFLAGGILFGFMLGGYIVVIIVYGAKLKIVGEFESIDVVGNMIIHITQKQGREFFQPSNISCIAFEQKPQGGITYLRIHFKYSRGIFTVPKTVSGYPELVKKIERFAEDNSIPLVE